MKIIQLLALLLLTQTSFAGEKKKLEKALLEIGVSIVEELESKDHFKSHYHLKFKQPIDHFDSSKGYFDQHIYLSHVDFTKPMLLETCGYEAHDYTKEISKMTQGNQLIVEYRFFGDSKPKEIDWKYLINKQSVEDYHRIVNVFKKLYSGKWISSGISKGGAMTITYRSKYPEDTDVGMPYVGPIAIAREDYRTELHQFEIGDSLCREKTFEFQRLALTRRSDMIELLKEHARDKGLTFSFGYERALEYAVLEYPFSFWQWNTKCNEIPTNRSKSREIFDHIENTVSWSFYSDKTIEKLLPSYYQHELELGYYGFPMHKVKDLLKVVTNPDNMIFVKEGIRPTYNADYMKEVWNWATFEGDQMIYIYGEYDTWTACAITPDSKVDALKMVKDKGNHGTRLINFSEEERTLVYDKLKRWLQVEITPLNEEK